MGRAVAALIVGSVKQWRFLLFDDGSDSFSRRRCDWSQNGQDLVPGDQRARELGGCRRIALVIPIEKLDLTPPNSAHLVDLVRRQFDPRPGGGREFLKRPGAWKNDTDLHRAVLGERGGGEACGKRRQTTMGAKSQNLPPRNILHFDLTRRFFRHRNLTRHANVLGLP